MFKTRIRIIFVFKQNTFHTKNTRTVTQRTILLVVVLLLQRVERVCPFERRMVKNHQHCTQPPRGKHDIPLQCDPKVGGVMVANGSLCRCCTYRTRTLSFTSHCQPLLVGSGLECRTEYCSDIYKKYEGVVALVSTPTRHIVLCSNRSTLFRQSTM